MLRRLSSTFAVQKGGDKLGFESEAFAIYDTMKYIKPEVHTLCVGTAFGESAMLLAAGTPVRFLHASTTLFSRQCSDVRRQLAGLQHPCATVWNTLAPQEHCPQNCTDSLERVYMVVWLPDRASEALYRRPPSCCGSPCSAFSRCRPPT